MASDIKMAIGKEIYENGASALSLAHEWELCTRTVYRYKEKVKDGLICHQYSGRPRILNKKSLEQVCTLVRQIPNMSDYPKPGTW